MFHKFMLFDGPLCHDTVEIPLGLMNVLASVMGLFFLFFEDVPNHFSVLMLAPIVLSAIIISIDGIANKWITFVTDAEKEWDRKAQALFFSQSSFVMQRGDTFERWLLLVFNFSAFTIPLAVIIAFPKLLLFIAPVAIVIGLVYGSAILSRKVYRTSKTLTKHIEDKNIHTDASYENYNNHKKAA